MILLFEAQWARISLFFPPSNRVPLVGDRQAISIIIVEIRNGLRWRDAPPSGWFYAAIYNRFIRWSEQGAFGRIFVDLAKGVGKTTEDDDRREPPQGTMDSGQSAQKWAFPQYIGRAKGRLNSKLHVVCYGEGRLRSLFLTAGQVSDCTGAAALLSSPPPAKVLLADRRYNADWWRDALAYWKI